MKERIWGEFLFVNITYLPIGFFQNPTLQFHDCSYTILIPGENERSWRIGLRSFHLPIHKFEESLFSLISIKEDNDVSNK